MSDIKVGDLVVVTKPRPCCGDDETVGFVGIVTPRPPKERQRCVTCNALFRTTNEIVLSNNRTYTLDRLKRIPPLSELESEKKEEKVKA